MNMVLSPISTLLSCVFSGVAEVANVPLEMLRSQMGWLSKEERAMYRGERRSLEDVCDVPPPTEQITRTGKPILPSSKWGDCPICSSPPVKPQGCVKCLQFVGCADCIVRWYITRADAELRNPACPMCRAYWRRCPEVRHMSTVDKYRQKLNRKPESLRRSNRLKFKVRK
ncbi:unnamed protein product [Caenorhabditis sp. 36 PRJEB53466]|nr:unnamed protein product [Caenorhabditis sp. 36 PRJEB53466]